MKEQIRVIWMVPMLRAVLTVIDEMPTIIPAEEE
jgi:hypothetical protein